MNEETERRPATRDTDSPYPREGLELVVPEDRARMTITVGAKAALRTALYIIGQVIRHPRTAISFEMWDES